MFKKKKKTEQNRNEKYGQLAKLLKFTLIMNHAKVYRG